MTRFQHGPCQLSKKCLDREAKRFRALPWPRSGGLRRDPHAARSLRHTFGLALLMSQLAWASAAHADRTPQHGAARKLAEDGVAALQSGDAKTAAQKLDKASAC